WLRIRSFATWAACDGFDWLSRFTISTPYVVPPTLRPFANALRASPSTYGSGSPKPAVAPVIRLTKPSVIVLDASAPAEIRGEPRMGPAAAPEPTSPPRPTPARLTSSRREIAFPEPAPASSVMRRTLLGRL